MEFTKKFIQDTELGFYLKRRLHLMAERNKAFCSPPFRHDKVKTEAADTTYDNHTATHRESAQQTAMPIICNSTASC